MNTFFRSLLAVATVWSTGSTGSVHAIEPPTQKLPFIQNFHDWTVTCDNGKRCVAIGAVDMDGPALILKREAGPLGGIFLSFKTIDPINPVQLSLDDRRYSTLLSTWSVSENRKLQQQIIATNDANAITAFFTAAKNAAILTLNATKRTSQKTQFVSLAGMNAALLKIDDIQGRVGTVTALYGKGNRLATEVPPAPLLPLVLPIHTVNAHNLSEVEKQQLIQKTMVARHADLKASACDSATNDPNDKINWHDNDEAIALTDGEALVGLACTETQNFNTYNLWYRMQRQAPYAINRLHLETPAGATPSTDIQPTDNQFPALGYIPMTGILTISVRTSGWGRAGWISTYAFDGTEFKLMTYSEQTKITALSDDDWPTVYRSRQK